MTRSERLAAKRSHRMWVRCVLYVALGAVGAILLAPAARFAYMDCPTPKAVVIRHTEVQILPVYDHVVEVTTTTTTLPARRPQGSGAASLTVNPTVPTVPTTTASTTSTTLPTAVDCTAHGNPFDPTCH